MKRFRVPERISRNVGQYLTAVIVVAVFSFMGVRLLSGSQAAPLTPATTKLSLAPANFALKQGELINIAVNLEVGDGDTAGKVQASVSYPADKLEMQSVMQACPLPYFSEGKGEKVQDGLVKIDCTSGSGVVNKQAVAYLVFKALSDTGDATLTINDDTSVVVSARANNQRILQDTSGSDVDLKPKHSSTPAKRKPIPNYKGKAICDNPPPGYARCNAFRAVQANGEPIAEAQALTTGLGPVQFHNAYQMPCQVGGPVASVCATPATYGPNIVIVDAGSYIGGTSALENDLAMYNQKFGIPPCTVANGCLEVLNQSGQKSPLPPPSGDWSGEINLDVLSAHAMCQTCKITLIATDSAAAVNLNAGHTTAGNLKPAAISGSWSVLGPSSAGPLDQTPYIQPGIAQFFSTGDHGVIPTTTQSYPADFPSVIAASGTLLQVNEDGTWASEVVWPVEVQSDGKEWGTGGGCSPVQPAPAWQKALPNWSTAGCGDKRASGDVSATGDPSSGALLYYNGHWEQTGGTSLSAPLLAAMYALAGGPPAGSEPGQILYQRFNSTNSHDITSGNNCTAATKVHCTAGAGFDTPSGLGTPIGLSGFSATAVTPPPSTTIPPTVKITAPTANATLTGVVPVAAEASDAGGIANVQILIDGSPLGGPDLLAPYGVNWNTAPTPDGKYTLTAVATGASKLKTTSAPVSVTLKNGNITPTPPPTTPPPTTPPPTTPPPTTPPPTTPPPTPPSTGGKKGDLNADGKVNVFDMSVLLNDWHKGATSGPSDLNGDKKINVFDLSILLSNWTK